MQLYGKIHLISFLTPLLKWNNFSLGAASFSFFKKKDVLSDGLLGLQAAELQASHPKEMLRTWRTAKKTQG